MKGGRIQGRKERLSVLSGTEDTSKDGRKYFRKKGKDVQTHGRQDGHKKAIDVLYLFLRLLF